MKKEFKVGDKITVEFEVSALGKGGAYCTNDARGLYNFWFNTELMKPIEAEFVPREMLVWDYIESESHKAKVLGVFKDRFIVESGNDYVFYKEAKELPKELENGNVYKSIDSNCIYYKTGENTAFGFNKSGQYIGTLTNMKWGNNFEEYPLENFKSLLIAEAEKRGFKSKKWVDRKGLEGFEDCDNDRIAFLNSEQIQVGNINQGELTIWMCGVKIFVNGIWAKIIE